MQGSSQSGNQSHMACENGFLEGSFEKHFCCVPNQQATPSSSVLQQWQDAPPIAGYLDVMKRRHPTFHQGLSTVIITISTHRPGAFHGKHLGKFHLQRQTSDLSSGHKSDLAPPFFPVGSRPWLICMACRNPLSTEIWSRHLGFPKKWTSVLSCFMVFSYVCLFSTIYIIYTVLKDIPFVIDYFISRYIPI